MMLCFHCLAVFSADCLRHPDWMGFAYSYCYELLNNLLCKLDVLVPLGVL